MEEQGEINDESYRAYNEIVGEALRNETYEYWFECVRNYLIGRDVWEVVDGGFAKPPEDGKKKEIVRWRRKNGIALHAILISCGTEAAFSHHISQVSEAKVAWDILNHIYNYSSSELESEAEAEFVFASPIHPSTTIATCTTTPTRPITGVTITQPQLRGEEVNYDASDLYKAIRGNNWNATKAFLEVHPNALTAKLTTFGHTPLHVAASFGHVRMVEQLVEFAQSPLEIVDDHGFTPLATSALYGGDPRIAQCMLNRNSDLIGIPNRSGALPVTLAFLNGHKEMGRYLYSVTPLELLKQNDGTQGIKILTQCFNLGELGIAMNLLQHCEELVLGEDKDNDGQIPIMKIAGMSSAFSNGSELVFWKRWIYNYINIQSTANTNYVRLNIQHQGKSEIVLKGHGHSLSDLLSRFISEAYNMLGIKEIYEMKLMHSQAAQILSLLCEKIGSLGSNVIKERYQVFKALFRAAKEGNVEFVEKVLKADPQLVQLLTKLNHWHIFFFAVKYRQPQVFNLIHGICFKNKIASQIDIFENTMLHVVADLAPPSKLNRISGIAFQMQSELQWFKEVESVVPEGHRVYQNLRGMQPQDVFKESHKDLRKEGEKWMKETASSCSLVGILVVTIMFAAAFTVPGGNNQESGYPIFLKPGGNNQETGYSIILKKRLFILFVISDALSLFSSTTSVLVFLGIFTSRYAEEDFLKSLPTKLIIGLSTLFVSIATMMIAFSTTIFLMLQHRSHSWIHLLVIMLASVPVTLFVLLQFPLLVQMISSTYGPGIFKRNVNPWL